jgi:hypothetical protein
MGMDIVEFIMKVEEAFDVRIPDRDAERIATPRHLINYLHVRMGYGAASCPTQKAFYAVRRELRTQLGNATLKVRPTTPLADVLPEPDRRRVWSRVGWALDVRGWPRAGPGSWLGNLFFRRVQTVGEAARYAAGHLTVQNNPPDRVWSWDEVACVVDRIIRDQFAINTYSLDDDFVEDFGL